MSRIKNTDHIEKIYFSILIFLLVLRSINMYSLLPSIVDSIIFSVLAVLGAIIVFSELYNMLKYKKIGLTEWLILLFLFIFLISSIVNRRYEFLSNIKLLVWNSIYLIGLYQFSKKQKDIRFLNITNYILIIGMFLISLGSLIMYIFRYSYVYVYGSGAREHIRIGFLESRLFGLFGDPNYGATAALIVIILSLYYLVSTFRTNQRVLNIFLISNVVLQYFVLILTGSRSALLLSYLVTTFISFCLIIYRQKITDKINIKKIIYALLLTALVIFGYSIIQNGTKDVLVSVPNKIHSTISKITNTHENQTSIPSEKNKPVITLERKDVADNEDISNMRFSIWKSAIEIFKSKPVFGTSPRGLLTYAHEKLPNTFISQKSIVVHNAYLNVLASIGFIGFIVFILLIIINGIKHLCIYFKYQKNDSLLTLSILAVEIIIVASGLFNNELVLVNTIGSFIFWCYLGYLNGMLKENIKK